MSVSNNPADSLVNIYVDNELRATGTVVAEGKIVTCLHVISSAFQREPYDNFAPEEAITGLHIEVEYKEQKYGAAIIRGNQHHDLCLLDVRGLSAPALPLAPGSYAPKENDRVHSAALPQGRLESGPGMVKRVNSGGEGEAPLVINSAPGREGCSGGALLNDNGEVIGIQSLPHAALSHIWVHELLARQDSGIISRSTAPETEVDYYFEAVSGIRGLPRDYAPFMNWILERPQSGLAAEAFINNLDSRDFDPEKAKSPKDYDKILDMLVAHAPASGDPRGDWLGRIDEVIDGTPRREQILKEAITFTDDEEKKGNLYFRLGEHHLYHAKNEPEAIFCFERSIELLRQESPHNSYKLAESQLERLRSDRTKTESAEGAPSPKDFLLQQVARCISNLAQKRTEQQR